MENNYYKILSKVHKKYQNHEKSKQVKNIQYQQKTSQVKKVKIFDVILYIIVGIFVILKFGIVLLVFGSIIFIYMLFKLSK